MLLSLFLMSEKFNPIFVYEIRQVVRNRLILGALCVYLILLIVLLGYELLLATQAGQIGIGKHFGAELTGSILRLLNGFSLCVLLIYTAMTTLDQGRHHELLFQTPIEAYTMGLGKAYSAALLTSLFYAVTLPFLTIAWMLRGVDILTLIFTLLSIFLLTQAINIYIAAAFFRCRDASHLLATLAGLFFALPPLIGIGGFSYLLVRFSMSMSGEFWSILIVLYWAAIITVMMFVTVSEMFRMNWQLSPARQRFGVDACFSWLGIFLGLFVGGTFFFPAVGIIAAINLLL